MADAEQKAQQQTSEEKAEDKTQGKGLPVSCQCGHIAFETPTPTPVGMAHCHCTECRKQSASAFGTSAYFPAEKLFPLPADLEAKLACFIRPTDSGNTMHCYFCPRCGVRIFGVTYLPNGDLRDMVSFKAGCIDGLDWTGAKHVFTRSAVVDIPAGAKQYETLPERWHGKPAPKKQA